MKKYTKICKTCGKEYQYCAYCNEFSHLPTWMILFHDENCKDIWFAISDYYTEAKSNEEIKAKLLSCDLSDQKHFTKKIQAAIKELIPMTSEKTTESQIETQEVINESNETENVTEAKNTAEDDEIKTDMDLIDAEPKVTSVKKGRTKKIKDVE